MSINELELFHGAMLAKLFRSDKPVSLRMVEMDFEQSRRAYLVNDTVYIYTKHSKKPHKGTRQPTYTWIFTFSVNHVNDLQRLKNNGKDVYLALVCGQPEVNSKDPIEICFLGWDQIQMCLDENNHEIQQNISVKFKRGLSFRVWGTNKSIKDPILVNQNALSDWDVPGV